jgi:cob(I)alamin adenosyltransferase
VVRIYTKTGDEGETALFDGTRVSKADARVDAYGAVDELSSWLGVVRSIAAAAPFETMLDEIQRGLFALGARLADPRHRIAARVDKAVLDDDAVRRLEERIDALEGELPPLRKFVLGGGTELAAALNFARAICRRAERRMVALGPEGVEPVSLVYINRLSDLLFTMARVANRRAGVREIEW